MPVSVTVTALSVRPASPDSAVGRSAPSVAGAYGCDGTPDWANGHGPTEWPSRNPTVAASTQPLTSESSTEWPTSRTASSWAFGYCAAVRRASSSGVRRSARPASTSTGTSGPA